MIVEVDTSAAIRDATTDALLAELRRRSAKDDQARSIVGGNLKKGQLQISPGSYVLVASSGISVPSDWWIALVKWADHLSVCIRHSRAGWSGDEGAITQVIERAHIRAVGSYADLRSFQDERREALRELSNQVTAAGAALSAARSALWRAEEEANGRAPVDLLP